MVLKNKNVVSCSKPIIYILINGSRFCYVSWVTNAPVISVGLGVKGLITLSSTISSATQSF